MNDQQTEIKKDFNDFIKLLKDGDLDIEDLKILKNKVFHEFGRLYQVIEQHQKQFKLKCPSDKRYIKFVEIPQTNAKVTYRPENGEILIKVPKNTSQFKVEALEVLGNKVKELVSEDIPMTLRGTAHWSETNKAYRVFLMSNNKTFETEIN